MNFLAHLFLADDTPESLLGNLAGDFVKGVLGERFTPGIRQGIAEHRRVDEFTDTHPEVAAIRRIIAVDHGHYSRVIGDVFLDHFLSRGWSEYTGEPREEFIARVFRTLDPLIDAMPGHLPFVYERMREGGWLRSYGDVSGIETALRNMSRRLSRAPRLEESVHLLTDRRDELQSHFQAFFPDVIAHVNAIRSHS